MRQVLDEVVNTLDDNGNPTGGFVEAVGIDIRWQNGPLGRHAEGCAPNCDGGVTMPKGTGCTRVPPNGAFIEGVIAAAIARLEFFEDASDGKFACEENHAAIVHLNQALEALDSRTRKREERALEGTHAA